MITPFSLCDINAQIYDVCHSIYVHMYIICTSYIERSTQNTPSVYLTLVIYPDTVDQCLPQPLDLPIVDMSSLNA